jgi:hypothetical protein
VGRLAAASAAFGGAFGDQAQAIRGAWLRSQLGDDMLQEAQNPEMTTKPSPLAIRVTAERMGGGIEYGHEAKGKKNGKIDLKKDSGAWELSFQLDTKLDLRFDESNPFLCDVTEDGACPTSLNREQIEILSCKDRKLVVLDRNYGDPLELHYVLNFTNRQGEPQEPYDPVIQNGGGIKRT